MLIVMALVSCDVAINLARPLQQRNGALPVVCGVRSASH